MCPHGSGCRETCLGTRTDAPRCWSGSCITEELWQELAVVEDAVCMAVDKQSATKAYTAELEDYTKGASYCAERVGVGISPSGSDDEIRRTRSAGLVESL